MTFPELTSGTCPATGDASAVIVYPDGSRECYHCGADA